MQGGKAPTARQKRWHNWLASLPCCATGEACEHLHHCAGSSARHNKIWIGQDWVVPLTDAAHMGPEGIHKRANRKRYEKEWFAQIIERAKAEQVESIPPEEVINAIMDYRR